MFRKGVKQSATFLWDAAGGNGADSKTLTGVIPIFSAPAHCLIHEVKAEVIAAVTGSSAEEVGDGTDVDGYLVDGFAANTGAYPLSPEDANCGVFQKAATATTGNTPEKKFYSAADTIDYKISGTATAGKIRFTVEFEVMS